MRQSNVEREEFWGFVLSEHSKSGLSVSEFCRREGVSQASFYQWRKRLVASSGPTTARLSSDGLSGNTSFIPVEVVSQPAIQSSNTAALTIRTPQGFAIDISNGTSANILECSLRVLQQLASESSS